MLQVMFETNLGNLSVCNRLIGHCIRGPWIILLVMGFFSSKKNMERGEMMIEMRFMGRGGRTNRTKTEQIELRL